MADGNRVFKGEVIDVRHLANDMHLMDIKGKYLGSEDGEEETIALTFGPRDNWTASKFIGERLRVAHLPKSSQAVGIGPDKSEAKEKTVGKKKVR